ncbi:E3 ubiquitin-protein ligase RNF4 [Gastrophryne carolinensis]
MTALTELIELEESREEVVDLTCESQESAVVVDLTHNDSVVFVEEHNSRRRSGGRSSADISSCILSSDDEDPTDNDLYNRGGGSRDATTSKPSRPRSSGGNVSCPICIDGYSEIIRSGRLIVSTKCGHIFCSQCLRDALKHASTCPTCRKKLTPKQYHPIYI